MALRCPVPKFNVGLDYYRQTLYQCSTDCREKPTYQDECAPVGKISCTHTYSARIALMSASTTNGSPSPAWLIAFDPHGRQERSEAFLSNGTDQQEADGKHDMEATVQAPDGSWLFKGERTSRTYAEAISNARHWASRDTTSSGTRINNTLSHDACSSRALSSLLPVFAASI